MPVMTNPSFYKRLFFWCKQHRWFLLILLLASLLRFVWLGSVPIGLSWDEAAIGYNGYGIAVVRRDEWLNKLPVTFKSFGDYKAAAAIYANAITTILFGSTAFAVRLPMAFAGILTVVATYGIAKQLFREDRYALISMFLVAVSPINIHYSRIGFESGVGVAFSAVAMWMFLLAETWWPALFASVVSAAASLYAYHSPKITLPILFVGFLLFKRKWVSKHLLLLGTAGVFGLVLLIPLVRETISGPAGERFFMTSVIANRSGLLPLPTIVSTLARNLQLHLDPAFLFFGASTTLRHGNRMFGILGFAEGVLLISILLRFRKKFDNNATLLPIIISIAAGFLPALISNDAPHSNRAHGIVPWIQLLATVGFISIEQTVLKNKRALLFRALVILTLVQTIIYSYVYYRVYTGDEAGLEFQYGYMEAVQVARSYESQVDHVVMTDAYQQPYIFVLFGKRLTPIQWQQGALANYQFRPIHWDSDKTSSRVLFIGSPIEIPSDAKGIVHEVRYPSGSVAFRIVKKE
ncbi:MAG TPA: glycosyltransferase family 39 protein [Patescibacteria group bacterium]|nr:glycosyltransferase family 39 protein [Patescibacteria group bacterium]